MKSIRIYAYCKLVHAYHATASPVSNTNYDTLHVMFYIAGNKDKVHCEDRIIHKHV